MAVTSSLRLMYSLNLNMIHGISAWWKRRITMLQTFQLVGHILIEWKYRVIQLLKPYSVGSRADSLAGLLPI